MVKFLQFFIILALILSGEVSAQYHRYLPFYNYKGLDINNIDTDFDNYGDAKDFLSGGSICWNNYKEWIPVVFSQGIGVIGKINGGIAGGLAQWLTTFTPGPIINGVPAVLMNSPDSVRYRVYKISAGDNETNNIDYKEWPFDLGAPKDKFGKPQLLGNQTLYTIYNGLDRTIQNRRYQLPPMVIPVEIHQTVFARAGQDSDSTDILSNVLFLEYSVV
ncbi:MAG: hypothetical protein ACM3RX_07665, partial [Methanococcaceae archaeon]